MAALDVGDALSLREAWDAGLTSLFFGDNPVVDLNGLLTALGVTPSQGSFGLAQGLLKFNVDLSRPPDAEIGRCGD